MYRARSSSFGMESFNFITKSEFSMEDWDCEKKTSTQRAARMGTLVNKAIARSKGFMPSFFASNFFSFSVGAGSNPFCERMKKVSTNVIL